MKFFLMSLWLRSGVEESVARFEKFVSSGENNFNVRTTSWSKVFTDYFIHVFSSIYSCGKNVESLESYSCSSLASEVVDKYSRVFKGSFFNKKDVVAFNGFIPNPSPELHDQVEDAKSFFKSASYEKEIGPLNKLTALFDKCTQNSDMKDELARLLNFKKKNKTFLAPSGKHYLVYIMMVVNNIIVDLKDNSKKYCIKYSEDGGVRCYYNMMNLYMHFFLLRGRLYLTARERKVLFAAAALHPAQDDYIDKELIDAETLHALELKLNGVKDVSGYSSAADPVFKLIDVVYATYPPHRHPHLVEIFSKLNFWQVESLKQKKSESSVSMEELLEITFMKGGYAFAFFGYIALGKMTSDQFVHFFSMGAIFQLMDDLHDINEDLHDGIETLFTAEIAENFIADRVMMGFLGLQKDFQKNTGLINDAQYPILVRLVELFGARYDTFRFMCMNEEYFSTELKDAVFDTFFYSKEHVGDFFSNSQEYETLDNFLTIIDVVKSILKKND